MIIVIDALPLLSVEYEDDCKIPVIYLEFLHHSNLSIYLATTDLRMECDSPELVKISFEISLLYPNWDSTTLF